MPLRDLRRIQTHGKRFEIDLSWLRGVNETTEDAQLLDDFASWQVNW